MFCRIGRIDLLLRRRCSMRRDGRSRRSLFAVLLGSDVTAYFFMELKGCWYIRGVGGTSRQLSFFVGATDGPCLRRWLQCSHSAEVFSFCLEFERCWFGGDVSMRSFLDSVIFF